jgi:hypothetical protein
VASTFKEFAQPEFTRNRAEKLAGLKSMCFGVGAN